MSMGGWGGLTQTGSPGKMGPVVDGVDQYRREQRAESWKEREWWKLSQLGDFKIGGWGWKWSQEEKRNLSAEQELSPRLLGEPEASRLSSAIPQHSGRLTPSLPKRAAMPYNILTAWVFHNATIQNGCDTYFQTQQLSLQRDSWASFSFRTQLSSGLFTLNMLAPTSWSHWFIATLQI